MQQMRQIEWKKYLSLLLCVHVRNFAANHHTPGNFHAPNCCHPIHSSSISGGRTTEIWLISFVITRQIVRYWIMNHSISSSTSFLSKIFWTSKISILVDFEDSDVWLCTFLLFLFFIVLHDAIWWQHCVLYWHNLTLPTSLIAVHNMPGDVYHSRTILGCGHVHHTECIFQYMSQQEEERKERGVFFAGPAAQFANVRLSSGPICRGISKVTISNSCWTS